MKKSLLKELCLYAVCVIAIVISFTNGKTIVKAAASTAESFAFTISNQINSSGILTIYKDNGDGTSSLSAKIDSNDIEENRETIITLGDQLGWSSEEGKIYFYEVGDNIYMVTGEHTILTSSMETAEKLAIINADLNGDETVTSIRRKFNVDAGKVRFINGKKRFC